MTGTAVEMSYSAPKAAVEKVEVDGEAKAEAEAEAEEEEEKEEVVEEVLVEEKEEKEEEEEEEEAEEAEEEEAEEEAACGLAPRPDGRKFSTSRRHWLHLLAGSTCGVPL